MNNLNDLNKASEFWAIFVWEEKPCSYKKVDAFYFLVLFFNAVQNYFLGFFWVLCSLASCKKLVVKNGYSKCSYCTSGGGGSKKLLGFPRRLGLVEQRQLNSFRQLDP